MGLNMQESTEIDVNRRQLIEIVHKLIDDVLSKQESDIISYMNEYMTDVERNRHGDNIIGYLSKNYGMISSLNMILMSRGFEGIEINYEDYHDKVTSM